MPPKQTRVKYSVLLAIAFDQRGCEDDADYPVFAKHHERLPCRIDPRSQAESAGVGAGQQAADNRRIGIDVMNQGVNVGSIIL